MRNLLLAGLLLCLWTVGLAQTNDSYLQGVVLDKQAKGIASATVTLLNSNQSTETDLEGKFSFKTPIGKTDNQLKVTALGYVSKTISLENINGIRISITLTQDEQRIEEVQVNAVRQEQVTAVRQSLDEQQIQESKGKVLAEVFGNMSGVSLLSSGHSVIKPVINGLHSNRILLLNQGIKQEGQQWGLEHAPEIDPFSAEQFELIKGAQAVRYGADALAGVLIAKSSNINTDKIQGLADLIGYSNGRGAAINAQLSGGLKAISGLGWKVQASGKKLGNSKAADYYMGNTGVEEFNFSGQLQYQLKNQKFDAYYSRFQTDLGVFYGAHVGTVEDILARIEHGKPLENYGFSYDIGAPRQQVSHQLGRLKYQNSFQSGYELEVQYGWQRNHRQEFDLRRSVSDDVPMSDMVLETQNLEAILSKNGHSIGMQAGTQVNNNVPGTGTTPIIPNFDSWSIGLFGLHQKTWNRFTAEAGWRYDYRHFDAAGYRYKYMDKDDALPQLYKLEDNREFHNFSGSLGGLYRINDLWRLKSSLGLAWRAPTANELYSDGLHHGAGIYEIGRLNLKAEQGYKWINSISRQSENFQFQADVYGQYISNYIYSMPNPDSVRQTIRGTFPVFSYTQHNALFYGLDLNLNWKIDPSFRYQVNAGLVRAKNLDLNSYLPYIPSDQMTHSLQWTYDRKNEGYIKFSHQFVAKQDRYEAGSDFAAPPAAYHLFHFYAAQPFQLGNNKASVALRVENLLNRSYKDYMDRFRYYADRQGRNIVLSLHYNF